MLDRFSRHGETTTTIYSHTAAWGISPLMNIGNNWSRLRSPDKPKFAETLAWFLGKDHLARNSLNGWSDLLGSHKPKFAETLAWFLGKDHHLSLGAPQSRNSISRIRTPFLSAKITENDEKDLICVI